MTALITLNNVAVRYPSPAGHGHQYYSVFDGINLTLQRGERLGVVGRNGVGKSTLLRTMAKIFAPYSGEVAWASSSVSRALPASALSRPPTSMCWLPR